MPVINRKRKHLWPPAASSRSKPKNPVIPNGPLALAARLREHLAAGADHVLVQLVTDGGAFDAGGLPELTELVADSAKLRVATGG